ncbi:MAG: NusG domain II-containing protein [Oscillospiraceae bacterium]|nr:NusG domain II-containing protein [Oscillospiraceae bacterium]MBQ6850810.1 NusG domain II-containing protein [Oscillospiraceae bacterium]MBR6608918.1 NusG domain II-containing protein [Oscillospiraceae bacterium]
MKKKPDINIFLTVGLIIFIVIMLAYRFINRETGDVAMVAIDGTEKRYEISLEEDAIHTIAEGNFVVTLEVKDGRIRFINSLCPDHLCEGFGFIQHEDESAICMPAGVAVLITDER